MDMIDLRSDTVTQPTEEMRVAMSRASVGDDVFGEDPTVNRLQEMAADMLGKEAALFVPTGTMGNLASVLAHCGRGTEVILGHLSHIHLFEAGGMAALGGVHPRVVQNQPDGTLRIADVEAAIRTDDPHYPVSRLIALESTHNRCLGAVLPMDYLTKMRAVADEYGLQMHLDGARFFNATTALGISPKIMAAPFDSVTFCLSKALSCPVGSLIVGDQAFIQRALRARKILGGGMRQVGVLAAAGIVALETMVDRLVEDHQRAEKLAQELTACPGIIVENPEPASNMIYVSLRDDVPYTGSEFGAEMQHQGVKIYQVGDRRFRLVVHYWIKDQEITQAVRAFDRLLTAREIV